eukprot:Awhi_evm1s1893
MIDSFTFPTLFTTPVQRLSTLLSSEYQQFEFDRVQYLKELETNLFMIAILVGMMVLLQRFKLLQPSKRLLVFGSSLTINSCFIVVLVVAGRTLMEFRDQIEKEGKRNFWQRLVVTSLQLDEEKKRKEQQVFCFGTAVLAFVVIYTLRDKFKKFLVTVVPSMIGLLSNVVIMEVIRSYSMPQIIDFSVSMRLYHEQLQEQEQYKTLRLSYEQQQEQEHHQFKYILLSLLLLLLVVLYSKQQQQQRRHILQQKKLNGNKATLTTTQMSQESILQIKKQKQLEKERKQEEQLRRISKEEEEEKSTCLLELTIEQSRSHYEENCNDDPWVCYICQNSNFFYTTNCRDCDEPRSLQLISDDQNSRIEDHKKRTRNYIQGKQSGKTWNCEYINCQSENFWYRFSCYKCQMVKECQEPRQANQAHFKELLMKIITKVQNNLLNSSRSNKIAFVYLGDDEDNFQSKASKILQDCRANTVMLQGEKCKIQVCKFPFTPIEILFCSQCKYFYRNCNLSNDNESHIIEKKYRDLTGSPYIVMKHTKPTVSVAEVLPRKRHNGMLHPITG